MSERMPYSALLTIGGQACEYLSCDINASQELLDDADGLRGTRSRVLERANQGLMRIGGNIRMNPTPVELAAVWPYCVQDSTGYTLTDAMQNVTVVHDVITKKNTYVGRFGVTKVSASPGQRLLLDLGFVGLSHDEAATSLNGTPDITVRPYMMQDSGSGITIGGTTYAFQNVELEINNHIVPTYMNGTNPTDLEPQDREVILRVKFKYNSAEAALQTLALSGPVIASPVTGSLAFTNGSNSVTFAFAALVAVPKTVGAPGGKNPLRWDGVFKAYRVGSTKELVTTFV